MKALSVQGTEPVSWDRVYRQWMWVMKDRRALLHPFFQDVDVHNPSESNPTDLYGRPYEAAMWWDRERLLANHVLYQEYLFKRLQGRAFRPDLDEKINKGSKATLQLLWDVRDDPERVAAALICASIYCRIAPRHHYPEQWPKRRELTSLLEAAEKRLNAPLPWQTFHTAVLPWTSSDWDYTIDNLQSLVRYLAEEHATLLHIYQPVGIRQVDKVPPLILSQIEKRAEQSRVDSAQCVADRSAWDLEQQEATRCRAEAEKMKTQQHPRHRDWPGLSDVELTALVWTHPLTTLAQMFGVSDTAIKKRCDNNDIPRPEGPFWTRVRANLLTDPKGIVPANVLALRQRR